MKNNKTAGDIFESIIDNINFLIISIFCIAIVFLTMHFQFEAKNNPHESFDTPEFQLPELKNKFLLDFSEVLHLGKQSVTYTNVWGKENISFSSGGVIHVVYPKGSYKPSTSPIGGAGFIQHFYRGFSHARFSYTFKFDENFDFVKGGKLPGLCGGTCSRGGLDTKQGFSTRFMWRKNGDLEVYAYLPKKEISMGESLGRGMFQFLPGVEYNISQELMLNTPGEANGVLVVYVNGKRVYENTSMLFRENELLSIDAILFSTFFGGGDRSWATPKQTAIEFKDFTLEF